MATVSDGAAIHQLLRKAFSDAEFSMFCFDHFLPVYEQFSGGMGLLDKIQRLIDYCYRQGQRGRLLKLVAAHNPYQYALYKNRKAQGGEGFDGRENEVVYHNLPQRSHSKFVGREAELKQIFKLLRPYPHSQYHLVVIDGIGGIGKSALALEVAHRYLTAGSQLGDRDLSQAERLEEAAVVEQFDAIVWVSAKESALHASGIQPRHQVLKMIDDIFTAVSIVLQRPDILQATGMVQDELVRQALLSQRTLLIVDNLETVADDERVLSFLRDVPPPTKVLVTTRERIDVAYPVRVLGMSPEDAQQLIKNEADEKGVSLADAQAELLFRRTGGVPLALGWCIAQAGLGYPVETMLQQLSLPHNDVASFCFQAAVSKIREQPAWQLLLALSLFQTDGTRLAVGEVAGLGTDVWARDKGLARLIELSLVTKREGRFSILPLTKAYCYAELAQMPDVVVAFRQRQRRYYSRSLKGAERYQSLTAVELEIENILGVMGWCLDTGRLKRFVKFAVKMDFFFWASGRWQAWRKYIFRALDVAREIGDLKAEGRLLRATSYIYIQSAELEKARQEIQGAIEIYEMLGNEGQVIRTNARLAVIEIFSGEYEAASARLQQGRRHAVAIGDRRGEARTLRRLAEIDLALGQFEAATAKLQRVRQIREPGSLVSSELANTYRLLGRAAMGQGDYERAQSHFEHSLEMAKKITSRLYVGRIRLSMAELALEQGNMADAHILLLEAREIFGQLSIRHELRVCDELLAMLASEH